MTARLDVIPGWHGILFRICAANHRDTQSRDSLCEVTEFAFPGDCHICLPPCHTDLPPCHTHLKTVWWARLDAVAPDLFPLYFGGLCIKTNVAQCLVLHKCSPVTHVLFGTLPHLLSFPSRFITPGLETAFCLHCRWCSVLALSLLDAPRTPTATKDMLLSRCPRASPSCGFHRRLVWPILLPTPRRSTNNDHRAQTDNHHSSVDGVVPCASKFLEKRCWCNMVRCNRCNPRIVLVPMPRVQGQRSTDLGGVTAAPEDRLLSFRLSLRRLLSLCSDFYWLTTCSCSTLSTMDYGQIWKTTLANFNSANDEPGKVCNS